MNKDFKHHALVCDCGDSRHQIMFNWFQDFPHEPEILYMEPLLNIYKPWYSRLWQCVRYMLKKDDGYFDVVILDHERTQELIDFLQTRLDYYKNVTAKEVE